MIAVPQPLLQLISTLTFVAILAYFFANVEIQIEGDAGWAANLPTWRIEDHWLLDVFWGGRAMTGYHAYAFSFITILFHAPVFLLAQWCWQLEGRIVASIMLFWIVEDYLWFVINPAFGWRRFRPEFVSWHRHWTFGAPVDYWIFRRSQRCAFLVDLLIGQVERMANPAAQIR